MREYTPMTCARQPPDGNGYPVWFDGKTIHEVLFCEEFVRDYPMLCVHDTFFTTEGRVTDETFLKREILERIKPYVTSGVAKRTVNLLDALRVVCASPPLPLCQDRIHVANGTLFLDGAFSAEKDFCANRLPVKYVPDAPPPVRWLAFLDELLPPDDILTLQEFMGYCLIQSTKGQKMLIGPRASPAKRVARGEEPQGSGRNFRRQAEMEPSGLCGDEAVKGSRASARSCAPFWAAT